MRREFVECTIHYINHVHIIIICTILKQCITNYYNTMHVIVMYLPFKIRITYYNYTF
jgi:hypothetical protein